MSPQDDLRTATLVTVLLQDPTDPRHVSTRLGAALQRAADTHTAAVILRLHPETYKRRMPALTPAFSGLPPTLRRRLDYRCNLHHDERSVSLSTRHLPSDVRCRA